MPNSEALDAKIASALNRIIHNSHFKRKVSREERKAQKEDRFLRGRQIACLIYEYFRVTGAHDTVLDYADLFTLALRNDDIQEFDSKWDGILLSMTKIPHDDILEGLYKLRIRECEKVKTVLELYNMEIHQKTAGPDHHRLKTVVKRSIEHDIRNRNFEARNGNFEKNAVVKNQGTKQRGQRILGDCWQWETNGQCVKGDNCSFRHDIHKRAKSTQPNLSPRSSTRQKCIENQESLRQKPKWKNGSTAVQGLLQRNLHNSFCEKWHPPVCLFYKSENGCRFGEKCSYAHRPSKRSKKNGDKSAVAMLKKNEHHQRTGRPVLDAYSSNTRQLGCVFQDMEPPKSSSILRKSSNIRKPIRCVKFTKAVVRDADTRDQNPSFGMICPDEPHQRNSNASKFEDRSQEETEWQEQGAREEAWKLAKSVLKL